MISRKIFSVIIMIISIFFYILFVGRLSFYTLVFSFAFPAAMLAVDIIGKFSIKCVIRAASDGVIKGEELGLNVLIENKSILPFPKSIIKIEYTNSLSENIETLFLDIPIYPRAKQSVGFSLIPDYCGIMEVTIANVRITDYVKLFSAKIKPGSTVHTVIYPEVYGSGERPDIMAAAHDSSDKFSKYKSGDDPSEIFELKDYAPGDKMSRIHWNLSSKQDSLITKHYSLEISPPAMIIPDIDMSADHVNLDETLEMMYSICYSLLENSIDFRILMPDGNKCMDVTDILTLNEAYAAILYSNVMSVYTADTIRKLVYESTSIYYITNKPGYDSECFSEDAQSEQNIIIIDPVSREIINNTAGSLNVIRIPAGMVQLALEEHVI